MKKLFTLVEILIVILIFSFFVVILFKLYFSFSNITIKISNENLVQNEILYFNQFFQNLIDKYNIDYTKYPNLSVNKGIVEKLYFTGSDEIEIFVKGDCNVYSWKKIKDKNCYLVMKKNGKEIPIISSGVYISGLVFKIMPLKDPRLNLAFEESYPLNIFVSFEIYHKKYNPNEWPLNVKYNYENLFLKRIYNE